jgi:hypothetical protein
MGFLKESPGVWGFWVHSSTGLLVLVSMKLCVCPAGQRFPPSCSLQDKGHDDTAGG